MGLASGAGFDLVEAGLTSDFAAGAGAVLAAVAGAGSDASLMETGFFSEEGLEALMVMLDINRKTWVDYGGPMRDRFRKRRRIRQRSLRRDDGRSVRLRR